MYCLFILCVSLYISLPHTCVCQAEVDPAAFERIIQDYFKSDSVRRFRKEWEAMRKPVENALITAMKDTVGVPGMNVYVKKRNEELAAGYFHNDNQVRVILRDFKLQAMPHCVFPDVKFTLASNVVKIHTALSKMIVHAGYALIRNKTDVIHDPKDQDPFKSSPFLFGQVQNVGKVAITMESCELKGFITAAMSVDSINLGHDRFNIINCEYTIEIYRPGEDSPPVIARYNMSEYGHGLGLTDLLKKPLLTDELIPKLQAAIFSFVNTSAIFGRGFREYRDNQDIIFLLTATQLAEVVRIMNKLTVEKNQGAIQIADYEVHWDNGKVKPSKKNGTGAGESLKLTQMVLTGLDTLYSAHAGGPFELDSVRIAEKLRFSSLQVRGKLEIKSTWSETFDFAVEISDLTLELHMQLPESNNVSKQTDKWVKDRKLAVEAMGHMTFSVPTLIFDSADSVIGGYLLNEVPKLINTHSIAMFDQAMQQRAKTKPPKQTIPNPLATEDPVDTDFGEKDEKDSKSEQSEGIHGLKVSEQWDSDNLLPEEIQGIRERDTFKKNKKRFKSANNPRRRRHRHTSGKRVANNKIRNK